MSIIKSGDYSIIVDDRYFQELNSRIWHVYKKSGTENNYIIIAGKKTCIKHLVLQLAGVEIGGLFVEHKNKNFLDNRLENLRLATQRQICQHSVIHCHNTSGYKGVSWSKSNKRWYAYICVDGKKKHLGYFDDVVIAAEAYNKAAEKYFGEFACVN